ncbi:hypothetical protein [Sporosarcina sp. ANT_H38]|nr:hypothetical protein [Sporosarcina sp. ANT_H38]
MESICEKSLTRMKYFGNISSVSVSLGLHLGVEEGNLFCY